MLALPCNNFQEDLEHNLKVGAPTNPTSFSYCLFGMNEPPKHATCVAQHGSGSEYNSNNDKVFFMVRSTWLNYQQKAYCG